MAFTNYIGNPDFRGYLSYLSNKGDTNARSALDYTGNDGGFDAGKLERAAKLQGFSVTGNFNDSDRYINDRKNYVQNAYNDFIRQTSPDNGGGASAGGSGSTVNGADLAAYDQSAGNIQSAIDRLGGQRSVGERNINDAYNNSLNKLMGEYAIGQRNYNTSKTQQGQDFVKTKNQINTSVGTNLTGLRRLLASRGAGASSAYDVVAPEAAARQGTMQRSDAADTFGRNQQALDTNWNDYTNSVEQNKKDLAEQKGSQLRGLEATINQNRASLLQNLANIRNQRAAAAGGSGIAASQPLLDEANSLLSSADQLGLQYANPVVRNNTPAVYNAPDLQSYTLGRTAQIGGPARNALTESVAPYLNLLMNRRREAGAF